MLYTHAQTREHMSLFTKFQAAIQSENMEEYGALYHDNFRFVRHEAGTTMNRAKFCMIEKMFASGAVKQDNHRCIYENDDIMVEHSFMEFPDGSRHGSGRPRCKTDRSFAPRLAPLLKD